MLSAVKFTRSNKSPCNVKQFQRRNLRVFESDLRFLKSFNCKPKIFRSLNLRKMKQLITKGKKQTVAGIVISPVGQSGKCLK